MVRLKRPGMAMISRTVVAIKKMMEIEKPAKALTPPRAAKGAAMAPRPSTAKTAGMAMTTPKIAK